MKSYPFFSSVLLVVKIKESDEGKIKESDEGKNMNSFSSLVPQMILYLLMNMSCRWCIETSLEKCAFAFQRNHREDQEQWDFLF